MTEQEWYECTDPKELLDYLRGSDSKSERKLRLLAVACCNSIWPLVSDDRLKSAVLATEDYADGVGTDDVLQEAFDDALDAANALTDRAYENGQGDDDPHANAAYAVVNASCFSQAFLRPDSGPVIVMQCTAIAADNRLASLKTYTKYIRDIFGNPFRPPPPLSASLLTPRVRDLAKAVYEERVMPQGTLDPEKLLALAAALREAGCEERTILDHLQEPGTTHVRGCWAVDLLLGKDEAH